MNMTTAMHGGGMEHGGHMTPTTSTMYGHHNVTKGMQEGGMHGGGMHSGSGGGGSHASSTMGMMHNDTAMDHGMKMWFHTSEHITLFFQQWMINSHGKFVGACFGLVLLGILYEGLKVWRHSMLKSVAKTSVVISNSQNDTNIPEGTEPPKSFLAKRKCSMHLLQTLLHIIQVFLGYLLMLAFMTYNTWICVSVLIGAGLGYLVFGWISPMTYMDLGHGDHCN